MAQFTQAPGFVGYKAYRASSLDGRALGKFTDTNHLYALHQKEPSDYDKKIISLYTQTYTYSNDFMQMIDASTPFYPDTETWKWDITAPYAPPRIVAIPATTAALSTPGVDGQPLEVVFDRKAFYIHDVITWNRKYGQQFTVQMDPKPYSSGGWLYTIVLNVPSNIQTSYASAESLTVGREYERIDVSYGEFDDKLSGLSELAPHITLYDTMAGAYGFEHTITKWADQINLKNANGQPMDLYVYEQYKMNEAGKKVSMGVRWEPFIEAQMRKEMLNTRVKRFIWSKPGTHKTLSGSIVKNVEGLYWKMRNLGNYMSYNRGEFSINMLRGIFGDLFYRRVNMQDRRVKMYTNEAGIEVFMQALKDDMRGSGLVMNVGDNNKFVQGEGLNMEVKYGFNKFYTIDTGTVEVLHLSELDEPTNLSEFGQNKKSTPVFMVFDITPDGDGTPKNNVREVRMKGAPSMTWGYINGRQHYLGHLSSQGMNSSSMFPGYKMWMEDRSDIFVEDLSRMVLIEEVPQF